MDDKVVENAPARFDSKPFALEENLLTRGKPPEIPIRRGLYLVTKTKVLYSKAFCPDDDTLAAMLQRLRVYFGSRNQQMSVGEFCMYLNIDPSQYASIMKGKERFTNSLRRLTWMLYCLHFHPRVLMDSIAWMTWGRVAVPIRVTKREGLIFKKAMDRRAIYRGATQAKSAMLPYMPRMFRPDSRWMNCNWSFSSREMGHKLGSDRVVIDRVRRMFLSFNKARLAKHIVACGKPLKNFAIFLDPAKRYKNPQLYRPGYAHRQASWWKKGYNGHRAPKYDPLKKRKRQEDIDWILAMQEPMTREPVKVLPLP